MNNGTRLACYHSEAALSVRKYLIEQAKKSFGELEKAETLSILEYSYHHKYKLIEERFEDEMLKAHDYNTGCQHTDLNQRITFKTYLDGNEL